MLSGVGQLCLLTNNAPTNMTQRIMFPGQFVDFTVSQESSKKEAKAWKDGTKQTVASAIGDTSWSLKLSYEYMDFEHLGFAYGEVPTISENVRIPVKKDGRLNADGYLQDPQIMADTDEVYVYVEDAATGGARLLAEIPGSPEPGEFSVIADPDGNGFGIQLNIVDANKVISYAMRIAADTIQTIGYESADKAKLYGDFSFFGKGYGPMFPKGIGMYIPSVSRSSTPTLNTDGVPKIEMDFTPNVVPGHRLPVQFVKWDTLVQPTV